MVGAPYPNLMDDSRPAGWSSSIWPEGEFEVGRIPVGLRMVSGATPPPKFLDVMRESLRVRHCSLRTEEAYGDWTRRFIIFHGKRHPKDMGAVEVQASLTHLAVQRQVAPASQNQAKATPRLLVVLSRGEIQTLFYPYGWGDGLGGPVPLWHWDAVAGGAAAAGQGC